MNGETSSRRLSAMERSVVVRILDEYSGRGAVELRSQLDADITVCGPITMLVFRLPDSVLPAPIPDGPLPVRAIVEARGTEAIGEILVWIRDGVLSGLEYAWYSANRPESLPSPAQVRVLRD